MKKEFDSNSEKSDLKINTKAQEYMIMVSPDLYNVLDKNETPSTCQTFIGYPVDVNDSLPGISFVVLEKIMRHSYFTTFAEGEPTTIPYGFPWYGCWWKVVNLKENQ